MCNKSIPNKSYIEKIEQLQKSFDKENILSDKFVHVFSTIERILSVKNNKLRPRKIIKRKEEFPCKRKEKKSVFSSETKNVLMFIF